jgi:hypothetical protein
MALFLHHSVCVFCVQLYRNYLLKIIRRLALKPNHICCKFYIFFFTILHIPVFFVNCSARYCNTWSFPRVLFKIVSTCTMSLCVKMFRSLDYIAYRMIYINQYFVKVSENFTVVEPIYGKEEYQLFDKSHLILGNHFRNR